ncbi:MAG: D-alanyl-D-alanine carboxypeptidase family protein [Pseudomonadota bacterium]
MRPGLALLLALAVAACGSTLPDPAEGPVVTVAPLVQPPAIGRAQARAYSAIVVDVRSGRVLHSTASNELRFPASLTKMMTLFIVFEEIKSGRLSLNDNFDVSSYAASRPPAKIGVKAGSTIRVRDAITAMAVKSGNDVATVIAENLSGSEERFALRMNRAAQSLGLTRTRFTNASGLPDSGQVTTARDMAQLGRVLKTRHPGLSRFFGTAEFTYNGRRFRNTNRLIGKVSGVDGIKTGYIRAAGYNLVASAKRGRRNIIVVVIGGKSGRDRNERVERLIERYL